MSIIGPASPAILPTLKFIPRAVDGADASSVSFSQQTASASQASVAKQGAADQAQSSIWQVQAAGGGLDFTV